MSLRMVLLASGDYSRWPLAPVETGQNVDVRNARPRAQSDARYYVLLLFAFLGTQQCYCWYTIASMPFGVADYFGLSKQEADALATVTMNYAGIAFCAFIAPAMYSLSLPNGLQRAMRFCAFLTFTCCFVRWVPCVLASSAGERKRMLLLVHVAQMMNAAGGPFYMSAASRVSAVWFPAGQRTSATSVAFMGGNLGMILGCGLGAVFSTHAGSGLPRLMLLELAISVVPAALVLWHCPDHPERSPAPAEGASREAAGAAADEGCAGCGLYAGPVRGFLKEVGVAVSSPSLVLLVLAGGLQNGADAAWGGLFPQIFATRFGREEADGLANVCGLLKCAASLCSMLLAGRIADTLFRRRLKQMMILCFAFGTCLNLVVVLFFPAPLARSAGGGPLLAAPSTAVAAVVTAVGFFQGMLDPLFLELSAEVAYPCKEGVSAGLVTLAGNVFMMLVLTAAPFMSAHWLNSIWTLLFAGCTALAACARQDYKRSDAERQHALESGVGSIAILPM